MKKLLSLVLALALVLTTFPIMSFAETPSEYIIKNDKFDGTTDVAEFTTAGAVPSASAMTTAGFDNTTPLKFGEFYGLASATYKPAKSALTKGLYEVFFYNVCQIDTSLETGNISSNVTYTVSTDPGKYGNASGISGEKDRITHSQHDFDPATASGGKNGWVSLGKHYFSGNGNETVSLEKYSINSNDKLYMSAVKFVPVVNNNQSDTSLAGVYLSTFDGAWTKTKGLNTRNTVSDIEDGHITAPYAATVSGRAALNIVTSNPKAKVSFVSTSEGSEGYNYLTFSTRGGNSLQNGPQNVWVYVTAPDGTKKEMYEFYVEQSKASPAANEVKILNAGASGESTISALGASTVLTTTGSTSGYVSGAWSTQGNAIYKGDTNKINVWPSKKFGDTITYTPNIAASDAGYYNVYAYNVATYGGRIAREVLATVTHNGLREEKRIPFGGAVQGDWTPIGKFYFEGGANETIALSNISSKAALTNFTQVKLEKSTENNFTKDEVQGVSVTAGGSTQSVVEASMNGYTMPLPKGEYNTVDIKVHAGSNFKAITVNGEEVTANTAKTIAINDKDNTVTIVARHNNDNTQTYVLNLHKQTKTMSLDSAPATPDANTIYRTGLGLADRTWSPLTKLPMDADGAGDSVFAVYSWADPADRRLIYTPDLKTTYGTQDKALRVLLWKPALGNVANNENYGRDELTVNINTGGYNYSKTIDWKQGNSEWVDLGVYLFHPTVSTLAINFETVEVGESPILVDANALVLLDTDMPSGVGQIQIGDKMYLPEEIMDKTIESGASDTWTLDTWNAEDEIYVNGALHAGNVTVSKSYNPGVNRYVFEVKNNDEVVQSFTLRVVSKENIRNAKQLSQSGTWSKVDVASVVSGGEVYAPSATGDELNWLAINLNGEADVYVYQHASDTEGTATVSVDGNVIGNFDNTATGWVNLGAYTFTGGNYITIKATSGTVFADTVKIVYKGTMYGDPVLVNTEDGVKAVADVYQTNTDASTAKVIVAKFDSTGKNLESVKYADLSISKAGNAEQATAIVGSGAGIYKAFLWTDFGGITPIGTVDEMTITE